MRYECESVNGVRRATIVVAAFTIRRSLSSNVLKDPSEPQLAGALVPSLARPRPLHRNFRSESLRSPNHQLNTLPTR